MLFENAHLDALLMTSTLFLSCFVENFFKKKRNLPNSLPKNLAIEND